MLFKAVTNKEYVVFKCARLFTFLINICALHSFNLTAVQSKPCQDFCGNMVVAMRLVGTKVGEGEKGQGNLFDKNPSMPWNNFSFQTDNNLT